MLPVLSRKVVEREQTVLVATQGLDGLRILGLKAVLKAIDSKS